MHSADSAVQNVRMSVNGIVSKQLKHHRTFHHRVASHILVFLTKPYANNPVTLQVWYSDGTPNGCVLHATTCVVRSSLVKPEQMTGSYELCMLIDGVVKKDTQRLLSS